MGREPGSDGLRAALPAPGPPAYNTSGCPGRVSVGARDAYGQTRRSQGAVGFGARAGAPVPMGTHQPEERPE